MKTLITGFSFLTILINLSTEKVWAVDYGEDEDETPPTFEQAEAPAERRLLTSRSPNSVEEVKNKGEKKSEVEKSDNPLPVKPATDSPVPAYFYNREVSVILTSEGYLPKRIVVFEGEKVRFFVTSTVEKTGCFIVSEKNLFLSAIKGQVSEGEAYFATEGKHAFTCPESNPHHKKLGEIVVMKRKDGAKRKIASEVPKYWMPKDVNPEIFQTLK